MRTKVKILPSKVMHLDGWNVLCEDGSVWQMSDPNQQVEWTQLHPPHEPPKHAADLAEALDVVCHLVHHPCPDAFEAAESLLKRHGIQEYPRRKFET